MREKQKSDKSSDIKAIIFDMNGVLALGVELKHGSATSKNFHQTVAKKLKINLDTWFDAIDSVYAKSIEGVVSEKKTINTISRNLKIPKRKIEKIIIETYKKLFKENKDLYKYAFKLKKKGYKIAILSDQWPFSKKAIYHKDKIKMFNVVVTSSDVGIRKPNIKIYKLTLRKLGLKGKETIFVDNRDWNLPPAQKLRIKTVLFKNNKQAIREIEKLLK